MDNWARPNSPYFDFVIGIALKAGTDIVGIGRRITKLRLLKKWTQKDLARRARVSSGYISRIEEGNISTPGVKTLVRIAEALGVEVKELYRERN